MESDNDRFSKAESDAAAMGMPDMGITELSQMCAVNKELFDSYIAADFTSGQALYLTSVNMTGVPGSPKGL